MYDATINNKTQYTDKYLLGMMIKMSNRAKKVEAQNTGLLAIALYDLFHKARINDKAKKLINYDTMKEAETDKQFVIDKFIKDNRQKDKWFYLASSHSDCAEDHKPYQGRLYVDKNAPKDVIDYAHSRGLYTVQWVMDKPAWFITRPNCRHYFVALDEKQVRNKTLKKLRRKYKTHRAVGDRDFQTPKTQAIAEYTDRLKMLKALYYEYPTDKLKAEILKTEMLIKKWKNNT